MKTVLDACCGSRMFWFDKDCDLAVFLDRRVERYTLKDSSVNGGQRDLIVAPNIQADVTALPFPANHFQMVVFDPPHFDKSGPKSWLRAKYGALTGDWRSMLRNGFSECFRVLSPSGVLIFKWSSVQIPLSEILKLTTERPLFGHRSGKHSLTHWLTFTKPNNPMQPTRKARAVDGERWAASFGGTMQSRYFCECGWRGNEDQILIAPNPFDGSDDLTGCPECKSTNSVILACDEQGCWRKATCGTPTLSGYRQTCGDHIPNARGPAAR